MVLKFEPWGDDPIFDWDEYNEDKIWRHGIQDFEIEECFENEHRVIPHARAKSEPHQYGDRFEIVGLTDGGRRLRIFVQYKGTNVVRPITAWEEN